MLIPKTRDINRMPRADMLLLLRLLLRILKVAEPVFHIFKSQIQSLQLRSLIQRCILLYLSLFLQLFEFLCDGVVDGHGREDAKLVKVARPQVERLRHQPLVSLPQRPLPYHRLLII